MAQGHTEYMTNHKGLTFEAGVVEGVVAALLGVRDQHQMLTWGHKSEGAWMSGRVSGGAFDRPGGLTPISSSLRRTHTQSNTPGAAGAAHSACEAEALILRNEADDGPPDDERPAPPDPPVASARREKEAKGCGATRLDAASPEGKYGLAR